MFWPSPAWRSWGRNRILHARDQQSLGPAGAGMGSEQRAASAPGAGRWGWGSPAPWGIHWGENFLTSGKGRGWAGPSRPGGGGGDFPFFLTQSYILACGLCEGPSSRGGKSARHPLAPPGDSPPPSRDTRDPLQHPGGLEVGERRRHLRAGPPPSAAPAPCRVFVPPAPRVSLRFSREPLSWRPRSPGWPQLCSVPGRGDTDTYRTPRREKGRPTQTSTAETLLCSSDGP